METETEVLTNPTGVTCPGQNSLFPKDGCSGWCFLPQSDTWWQVDMEIIYYITKVELQFTTEQNSLDLNFMIARNDTFEDIRTNVSL